MEDMGRRRLGMGREGLGSGKWEGNTPSLHRAADSSRSSELAHSHLRDHRGIAGSNYTNVSTVHDAIKQNVIVLGIQWSLGYGIGERTST